MQLQCAGEIDGRYLTSHIGGYRTWVPSRPSQQVTVIAVNGQAVVRDCAWHDDADGGSVMAATVAAVLSERLLSRAHGALLLPATWRGR